MVKVSGDKNLGERGNLAVNGQMPSVASISQRQGSERRVIYYSILKNKSKLPLCSIVRWGQERGKDNIPERPPFFKAEETLASFPLLTFGLWMLKNQFCVSVVRGYSRDEFPSASPFCHFGNQWLSPRSRSRSYSHTQDEHPSGELLKTPADPKRVTPGGREPCYPTEYSEAQMDFREDWKTLPRTQTSTFRPSLRTEGLCRIDRVCAADYSRL